MSRTIFQDQTFDKQEFHLPGEFENCTFKNCNLNGADLSSSMFAECTFAGCDLSLAKLNKTILRDVVFKDCKMLGLRFDLCNEFGLSFRLEGCVLNHSSFYKTNLKKTIFKNSQLQETDFSEADLTSAVFDQCDLRQATFDRTNLEKADFRSASNLSIDPENNRIKKARFSLINVTGLLNKYQIDIE
jgi:uncharacterized protein YjbI with pentapeptide repeats